MDEPLASLGKDRRMAGEAWILIVIPMGEEPRLGRIGLAMGLDNGNAHDHGHGNRGGRCEHGRTYENERPLRKHRAGA